MGGELSTIPASAAPAAPGGKGTRQPTISRTTEPQPLTQPQLQPQPQLQLSQSARSTTLGFAGYPAPVTGPPSPGPTSPTVTRVMSPSPATTSSFQLVEQPHQLALIRNTQWVCQVCDGDSTGHTYVCGMCDLAGHHDCLNGDYVQDFYFCRQCLSSAHEQWRRYSARQQETRWITRIQSQLTAWQPAAITTTGVMGAVGVAIGSAVKVAASGSAALVRGAAEGVRRLDDDR